TEARIGLTSLPGPGDEVDYDQLAVELAAGNGLRVDYDNPVWRGPYERANADGKYDPYLERRGAAPTTYRPPLFPAVMAGLYSVFGRSFAAVRVFNCLAMAAAGAVAAWLVARRLGPLPGLLCGFLFAVLEHRARYYAGPVLTESLASLFTVLLAAALIRLAETGRLGAALTAGLLTGLGALNRSLVALWLPVLIPLAAWLVPGRRVAAAVAFTLAAGALLVPWGVRNSLLLGRFAPLGTHGQQNLAAAFSDGAFARRGIWYNLDDEGFFPPEIDDSQPGLDRELARAEYSQRAAFEWIRENPLKVPLLVAMRVRAEWRPWMFWDGLVLGLAALGLVLWPVAADRRVFVGLLAANTLAVAATWSVAGRFLVPMLPILHAAAACGLWAAILAATERRSVVRGWLTNGGERGS
ncbi:MAG TPA: glycosyltransferase family 39 protein, partial [Planctomycetaceae bacterium]